MKDYKGSHGEIYEQPEEVSWTVIPVLEFLNGIPYGMAALNYIHALNPSMIRVTTGEVKTDFRNRRVTVYIDNMERIRKMEQEVEVGCHGYYTAHDMDTTWRKDV